MKCQTFSSPCDIPAFALLRQAFRLLSLEGPGAASDLIIRIFVCTSFMGRSKTDLELFYGRRRRGEELADRVEHDLELLVVLIFHAVEFTPDVKNSQAQPLDLDKSPHNVNVDLNGIFAAENA